MTKALRSTAPLWNGRVMATVCTAENHRKAGLEIQALGFRVQESKNFPPLDPNAHGSASQGGWHYAYDGTGAFDINWIHEGANTWVETMLIDLYVIPILRKHKVKGILHKPRNRSDHKTWCHADRGSYNDYTVRSYGAANRAYAAKLIAKYRTGAVGSTAQQAAVSSGKQAVVVDGLLGSKTIAAWQRAVGTTVDGKISDPSALIAAVQKRLNEIHKWSLTVDGRLGEQTISALQRHYKTTVDGKISTPSMLVSALQRDLNRRDTW